jgi:hypothetical protein
MSDLLPVGLMSLHEAATYLMERLFAGAPASPIVQEIRDKGFPVDSREQLTESHQCLRKLILRDELKLHATGGVHGKDIRLTGDDLLEIPGLKTALVSDLSYLRPSHRFHGRFVNWFGIDLSQVGLGVEEHQVHKLTRKLVRARRRTKANARKGRPRVLPDVQPVVQEIVVTRRWTTDKSQKELAYLVNQQLSKSVSQTSVTRALDTLYEITKDPRFKRIRRQESARGRKHAAA